MSESLNVATMTFERINSQGTPMSTKHMVHALTWSGGFDLQARLEVLKAKYLEPMGWASVEDDRVLDVCGVALGLRLLDRDVDQLSARLNKDPGVVEIAIRGMRDAAEFFRDRCYIGAPELVPYKEQVTLITEGFRICPKPSETALEVLRAWMWLSTYGALFSGSSVTRLVGMAIEDVRRMIVDGKPRWPLERGHERQKLFPGIDMRTPRAKALAVRLAERARLNPSDGTPVRLLAERGTQAIRRLFPEVRASLRGSPGNCFLAAQETVAHLRNRLRTLPVGPELAELQRAHVVSEVALTNLRAGRVDDFIVQRRNNLDDVEEDFLAPLVERFKDAIPSRKP